MVEGPVMYRIPYEVAKKARVHLAVHRTRGPLVSVLVDEQDHKPGEFVAEFRPSDASELYYYVLQVGSHITTQGL